VIRELAGDALEFAAQPDGKTSDDAEEIEAENLEEAAKEKKQRRRKKETSEARRRRRREAKKKRSEARWCWSGAPDDSAPRPSAVANGPAEE
jgi:hypothetical protein